MSDLSFKVSWLPSNCGPIEIKETSAWLKIAVCDQVATMIDDQWSQSVQSYIRVSAYPLALWIASSWWRLRWETTPANNQVPDAQWRMAHDVAAAGHGFIWPSLNFEGGDVINVVCRPSEPCDSEPIRYTSNFRRTIDSASFERGIDEFMELVLARLHACRVVERNLTGLWNEILKERRDPLAAQLRKIEAQLGYEPDDAPEGLLE